jgi:hypothetical protein
MNTIGIDEADSNTVVFIDVIDRNDDEYKKISFDVTILQFLLMASREKKTFFQ